MLKFTGLCTKKFLYPPPSHILSTIQNICLCFFHSGDFLISVSG